MSPKEFSTLHPNKYTNIEICSKVPRQNWPPSKITFQVLMNAPYMLLKAQVSYTHSKASVLHAQPYPFTKGTKNQVHKKTVTTFTSKNKINKLWKLIHSIKSWMTIDMKWLDNFVQCWQLLQMSAIKVNPVNIITYELGCI